MSLCLVIRENSHIWCSADTAISAEVDGKRYRVADMYGEKVFCWNNNLVFTCGLSFVGDELRKFITGQKGSLIDLEEVQRFLRYVDTSLVPEELQYRETSVLICTRHGDIIGLKQSKDYKIVYYKRPAADMLEVIADGYRNNEAMEVVRDTMGTERDILRFYQNIYGKMACNSIGGKLVLFHLNTDNQTVEKFVLNIDEPESIDFVDRDFLIYRKHSFIESGAETSIKSFMKDALDVAKNEIMSSTGQAITLDETGLRIRKRKDGSDTEYEPFQIWMNNGMIMFTADGWSSGNIAIGQVKSESGGIVGGVIADVLVGKMLASNNMVIESAKKDGGKAVFRVDGNGAALYNSTLDVYNGSNTQVTINPYSGIAIGKYPLYSGDDYKINTNNAKFWVDANGDVFIKGNITMTGGSISWNNIDETTSASYKYADSAYKYAGEAYKYADGISVAAQQALDALKTGLGYTYISGKYVISPNIVGGSITAQTTLNVGNGSFTVDSAGNVYMKGVVQASDFRNLSGQSMMTGDYKFDSKYLSLLGINVGNGNFVVDSAGNVSIRGNIQMGAGSSINWNYVNSDPLATNARDTANNAYGLANTANNQANSAFNITQTIIDGRQVISPRIVGGSIASQTTIDVGTDATIGANLHLMLGQSAASNILFGSKNYNTSYGFIRSDPVDGNFRIGFPNACEIRFSKNGGIYFSGDVQGVYATFA